MSKIERFTTEQQLTKRLEALRDLDTGSGDIKIISQYPLTGNYESFNNITLINAEGSAWDKIISFFSSGDPTDRVFKRLDLSLRDRDEYRQALEQEEILLYIDSEPEKDTAESGSYDYDSTSTHTSFDRQDKYVSEENMTDFTENINDNSYNSLSNEEKIDEANLREENKKLNQ